MYKLIEVENKCGTKLVLSGEYGTEDFQVLHTEKTFEELKEGVDKVYAIEEGFPNFERLHLVSCLTKKYAIQIVEEYIERKHGLGSATLLGAYNLEF